MVKWKTQSNWAMGYRFVARKDNWLLARSARDFLMSSTFWHGSRTIDRTKLPDDLPETIARNYCPKLLPETIARNYCPKKTTP
jgi:hypothetical protein